MKLKILVLLVLFDTSLARITVGPTQFDFRDSLYYDRRATVRRVCEKLKLDKGPLQEKTMERNLIYDRQYEVTYCKVPKAGSSFWVENFANISGLPRDLLHGLNLDDLHLVMKNVYR